MMMFSRRVLGSSSKQLMMQPKLTNSFNLQHMVSETSQITVHVDDDAHVREDDPHQSS
jgi:hypothetical protein